MLVIHKIDSHIAVVTIHNYLLSIIYLISRILFDSAMFSKPVYPILTPIPAYYRRVLIFDVETTGLIPKPNPAKANPPRLNECPYIIQLSFVVFNIVTNRIEQSCNAYVSIPEEIEITEQITEITGITRDIIREKGQPIITILKQFYEAYIQCNMVIAHNLDFDQTMIGIEIARNTTGIDNLTNADWSVESLRKLFSPEFNALYNIDMYCTMIATVDLCGIMAEYTPPSPPVIPVVPATVSNDTSTPTPVVKKPAKPHLYKKYPKLSELHQKLFGSVPENLHNALIDTMVCLRCFMKIRCCVDVSDTSFDRMLRSVTKMCEIKVEV